MEATKKYLLTLVRMALTKTSTNNKCEERVWIKGNPHTLLVVTEIGTATMENSIEVF